MRESEIAAVHLRRGAVCEREQNVKQRRRAHARQQIGHIQAAVFADAVPCEVGNTASCPLTALQHRQCIGDFLIQLLGGGLARGRAGGTPRPSLMNRTRPGVARRRDGVRDHEDGLPAGVDLLEQVAAARRSRGSRARRSARRPAGCAGSVISARATAARCFCPPETS